MSQLVESIRIKNGRRYLLDYHSKRLNHSLKILYGIDDPIDLRKLIKVPDDSKKGVFKCSVVYDNKSLSVSFTPYQPIPVQTLRIVHDRNIRYDHKFTERGNFNQLLNLRSGCDDVLIVRDGLVSDTSICNIVFMKDGNWVTPKSCLLRGVQRQYLLHTGRIKEVNITLQQLYTASHFKLINAMKLFSSAPSLPIENIRY